MSTVILTVAAKMAACGNKSAQNAESTGEVAEANDDSPAMRLLNSVSFTEEGLVSMVTTAEKGTLTPDEYEAMYLAYSKVPISEKALELEKNFVGKAIKALCSKSDLESLKKTVEANSGLRQQDQYSESSKRN